MGPLCERAQGGRQLRRRHSGDHKDGVGNFAEQLGIQNGNDRGPWTHGPSSRVRHRPSEARYPRGTALLRIRSFNEDGMVMTEGRHIFIPDFSIGDSGWTLYWRRLGYREHHFRPRLYGRPRHPCIAGGGSGVAEADFFFGLPMSRRTGKQWGHTGDNVPMYLARTFKMDGASRIPLPEPRPPLSNLYALGGGP